LGTPPNGPLGKKEKEGEIVSHVRNRKKGGSTWKGKRKAEFVEKPQHRGGRTALGGEEKVIGLLAEKENSKKMRKNRTVPCRGKKWGVLSGCGKTGEKREGGGKES